MAARYGATLLGLHSVPALTDRRLWHADRLHLNVAGHARVAAAVLDQLGVTDPDLLGGSPGWWTEPLPTAVGHGRRQALVADLTWARAYFAPWIWRRLRGVSSEDGRVAKDADLRQVEVG